MALVEQPRSFRRIEPPPPGLCALVTSPLRPLPNLLVIGAQKCGTTSLHMLLSLHPEICMASAKECNELVRPRPTSSRYRGYFPMRRGVLRGRFRWFGESTPFYIFHPAVPSLASRWLRGVHAIAVLRDPVERAWSHYRHNCRLGLESIPFEEAIDRESERMALSDHGYRHHSYVARGCYAPQLERWFDALGRERVLVLEFSELSRGAEGPRADIARFLGLRSPVAGSLPHANSGGKGCEGLDPRVRERLRAVFAPQEAALCRLVGRRFDWGGPSGDMSGEASGDASGPAMGP